MATSIRYGTAATKDGVYDSYAEFLDSGGAQANPGPVWIGNMSCVSDGYSVIKPDGSRLAIPNITQTPTWLLRFENPASATGGTTAWILTPTGARDTYGNPTLKFEVPGSGAGNASADYDVSANLAAQSHITLYVYGNRPVAGGNLDAANNTATLLISTSGNFTQYFSRTITPINEGLNVFVLPLSGFTNSGTADWATVNKVRFRVSQNASAITRACEFVGITYGGRIKPTIVITNDDSRPSGYSVLYPLLKQWGLRATYFVIPQYIEASLGFTAAQMREMMRDGIEIGLHDSITLTDHQDWLAAGQRYKWVREKLSQLAGGGPIAPCLAYPLGQYAGATPYIEAQAIKTQQAMAYAGIKSAYIAGTPMSATSNVIDASAQLLDVMRINRYALNTTNQLAAAQGVYADVKAKGGAICFMSHLFGSGYGAEQWDSADTATFINQIGADYQAGLIDVVTASEFAGYFS